MSSITRLDGTPMHSFGQIRAVIQEYWSSVSKNGIPVRLNGEQFISH
jgi:hypothetical protein